MSEWASIQIQLLLKLNNDDAQLCEVRKANSNTTLVKVKWCRRYGGRNSNRIQIQLLLKLNLAFLPS